MAEDDRLGGRDGAQLPWSTSSIELDEIERFSPRGDGQEGGFEMLSDSPDFLALVDDAFWAGIELYSFNDHDRQGAEDAPVSGGTSPHLREGSEAGHADGGNLLAGLPLVNR